MTDERRFIPTEWEMWKMKWSAEKIAQLRLWILPIPAEITT